jgi:hypothetical protein
MAQPTIDPAKPGKSTDSDQFKDPFNQAQGPSGNGASRDGGGQFKSMSYGGSSPDGDAMVSKYKPRGGGSSGEQAESGSELNDEGTDWD